VLELHQLGCADMAAHDGRHTQRSGLGHQPRLGFRLSSFVALVSLVLRTVLSTTLELDVAFRRELYDVSFARAYDVNSARNSSRLLPAGTFLRIDATIHAYDKPEVTPTRTGCLDPILSPR